jgi:hypothetical protein
MLRLECQHILESRLQILQRHLQLTKRHRRLNLCSAYQVILRHKYLNHQHRHHLLHLRQQ